MDFKRIVMWVGAAILIADGLLVPSLFNDDFKRYLEVSIGMAIIGFALLGAPKWFKEKPPK